jgi:PTH1 family peptidyl-tRNA hydrolase
MFLIVGLGNPGGQYQHTRHNVGFLVAERLCGRDGAAADKAQLGALVGKARVGGQPVVVAMPQGYMNRSGHPTASLRGYYKAEVDQVVVVHDDLDLPFGDVRVKKGGGHGGHNGLRDIQAQLGSGDFLRVRVGISRPPAGWDTADYVLAKWTADEQAGLDAIVDKACDAVSMVVEKGALAAMNQFNTKVSEPKPKAPRPAGGPTA